MSLGQLGIAIVGGFALGVWVATTAILAELRKVSQIAEQQRQDIMAYLGRMEMWQRTHGSQLREIEDAVRGEPRRDPDSWIKELAAKVNASEADQG